MKLKEQLGGGYEVAAFYVETVLKNINEYNRYFVDANIKKYMSILNNILIQFNKIPKDRFDIKFIKDLEQFINKIISINNKALSENMYVNAIITNAKPIVSNLNELFKGPRRPVSPQPGRPLYGQQPGRPQMEEEEIYIINEEELSNTTKLLLNELLVLTPEAINTLPKNIKENIIKYGLLRINDIFNYLSPDFKQEILEITKNNPQIHFLSTIKYYNFIIKQNQQPGRPQPNQTPPRQQENQQPVNEDIKVENPKCNEFLNYTIPEGIKNCDKKTYIKESRKVHPDKHSGSECIPEVTGAFQKLQNAWEKCK